MSKGIIETLEERITHLERQAKVDSERLPWALTKTQLAEYLGINRRTLDQPLEQAVADGKVRVVCFNGETQRFAPAGERYAARRRFVVADVKAALFCEAT